MRRMRSTQEIVHSIDARLRELHEEIKTLDAARAALDNSESHSRRRGNRRVPNRQTSASGASRHPRTSAESPRRSSAPAARQRPPGSSSVSNASRSKPKGASNALPAERVESLLSRTGGLSTAQLAAQANADRDQIVGVLRELETAGRVRRTGQRRATRWHVITDEDRIRERVAELEATRKRSA